MKEGQEKTGVFTLRSLLEKQNRTKLAVVLGAAAMILLLLSELLPTNAVKAPVLARQDEKQHWARGKSLVDQRSSDTLKPRLQHPFTKTE